MIWYMDWHISQMQIRCSCENLVTGTASKHSSVMQTTCSAKVWIDSNSAVLNDCTFESIPLLLKLTGQLNQNENKKHWFHQPTDKHLLNLTSNSMKQVDVNDIS